jgi:acyl carrier protein
MTIQITAQDLSALLLAGADLKIPAATLTPDTEFQMLGIDSLALLGLTAEIERRYQVRLSVEPKATTSVAEFLRSVNDHLLTAA